MPASRHDLAELEFAAELLRAQAEPITTHALRLLTHRAENAQQASTLSGRQGLLARLHDLAAAVSAGRPDLFALQLTWARQALAARRVPIEALRSMLGALQAASFDALTQPDCEIVAPYFDAARRALDAPADVAPERISADTPHGRLAARFLHAVLEGDRHHACELMIAAVRSGLSPADAYLKVFAPALQEMGRMWHLGEVNVAEEHFATTTAMLAMSQILPLWPRKPANGRTVIVACVDGNLHEIGARMTADFFETEGWRTIYLGASVPAEDLASAADDYHADVVCLSVSLTTQLQALRETIRTLRRSAHRPLRIIAGGAGLRLGESLAREHGADAYASSPADAVHGMAG